MACLSDLKAGHTTRYHFAASKCFETFCIIAPSMCGTIYIMTHFALKAVESPELFWLSNRYDKELNEQTFVCSSLSMLKMKVTTGFII